jgi:hypothetical protein
VGEDHESFLLASALRASIRAGLPFEPASDIPEAEKFLSKRQGSMDSWASGDEGWPPAMLRA